METIIQSPGLNTTEADIAYRRVDAILRAYGVHHAAVRAVHIQRILSEAVRQQSNTSEQLEAVAAGILLQELQTGLSKLAATIHDDVTSIHRHSLLISVKKAQIPLDHPETLLGLAPLSGEAAFALRRAFHTQNHPVLRRSSMGPPTLRFESIDGLTSRILTLLDSIPFLKQALPSVGVLLVFLVVYLFAK